MEETIWKNQTTQFVDTTTYLVLKLGKESHELHIYKKSRKEGPVEQCIPQTQKVL